MLQGWALSAAAIRISSPSERDDPPRSAIAKLARIRRDRVEHGLHVALRLADYTQDFTRRRLPLQRLANFSRLLGNGLLSFHNRFFGRRSRLLQARFLGMLLLHLQKTRPEIPVHRSLLNGSESALTPLFSELLYGLQIIYPVACRSAPPLYFGFSSARWRAVPSRILNTCGSLTAAD